MRSDQSSSPQQCKNAGCRPGLQPQALTFSLSFGKSLVFSSCVTTAFPNCVTFAALTSGMNHPRCLAKKSAPHLPRRLFEAQVEQCALALLHLLLDLLVGQVLEVCCLANLRLRERCPAAGCWGCEQGLHDWAARAAGKCARARARQAGRHEETSHGGVCWETGLLTEVWPMAEQTQVH